MGLDMSLTVLTNRDNLKLLRSGIDKLTNCEYV